MVLVDTKQRLVDYFKKNLAKGYTFESLKIALLNQGYSRAIIERAIEQTNRELAKKAPVLKDKPKIIRQIIDGNNNPITIKKFWWERFLN